jgi:hypothetical protein
MEPTNMTSLDEAVQLVDEARRQLEVEITALRRLVNEGQIQASDCTRRQTELRQAKAAHIKDAVANALSQTYSGTKLNQARYLKAAYDHLTTGAAKLEAFAWKDAQMKARLHSEEAYRQERNKEREAIQGEAQALTREQLFPTTIS